MARVIKEASLVQLDTSNKFQSIPYTSVEFNSRTMSQRNLSASDLGVWFGSGLES